VKTPRTDEPSLRPLGILAPEPGSNLWPTTQLAEFIGLVDVSLRDQVAAYLESCPLFLAWMEHTTDVIGGKFGVSGGSGIVSDGEYYWRLDAAQYVREYGLGIPSQALDHMASHKWEPPTFADQEYKQYA
jgi:hypothetical protein